MNLRKIFVTGIISLGILSININASAIGATARPAPSISTPKPSVSISKPVTSTNKATTNTNKRSFFSSNKNKETKTTTFKTIKNNAKYKGAISKNNSSKYYKPKNTNKTAFERFKDKPYYNPSTGFATGLLTASGAYLLLDSINDNDEPVYIDSETGDKISPDQLNDMKVNAVDSEDEKISPDQSNDNSDGTTALLLITIFGFGGLIMFLLFKMFK